MVRVRAVNTDFDVGGGRDNGLRGRRICDKINRDVMLYFQLVYNFRFDSKRHKIIGFPLLT